MKTIVAFTFVLLTFVSCNSVEEEEHDLQELKQMVQVPDEEGTGERL